MKTIIALFAAATCVTTVAMAASSTDTDFATKAAQAGMAEVAAGKVAESKGASASVKAFGKRMVADHTKAGDELKKVADKSGVSLPASPSPEQQQVNQRLEGMQGADFDRAYSQQMVKDHEEAVALFKNEASAGSDANLKAFAQKTLPTLEQHLKMAQALPEGVQSKAH